MSDELKPFIVKKNSWHWRWIAFNRSVFHPHWPDLKIDDTGRIVQDYDFVKFYDDHIVGAPYNFCMYWRAVLLWPVLRVAAGLVLYGTVLAIIAINFVKVSIGALVMLIMAAAVGITLVLVYGAVNVGTKMWNKQINKFQQGQSFLGTAYSAYKSKYCPAVEYVKGDK